MRKVRNCMNAGLFPSVASRAHGLVRGAVVVGLSAAGCGVLALDPPVATAACSSGQQTFEYTGGEQCYTVPAGVTQVRVAAMGAPGEAPTITDNGGYGAAVSAL